MKKTLVFMLSLVLLSLIATTSFALNLYVDAAPNMFGSPNYSSWKSNTYSKVVAGTFQNMANGANPANVGTTNFEIQDEVVYGVGDLGKRLTWTYWIPNETVNSLAGRFEMSLTNIWGNDAPWDAYNSIYGSTWVTPVTSWENVTGGVIGSAGIAWVGSDVEDTLAAEIAAWGSVSESWIFSVKLDDVITSMKSNRNAVAPVPEPSTLLLLGGGLAWLAWYRRKRRNV